MKLKIEITMDGAAFDHHQEEAARILNELAAKVLSLRLTPGDRCTLHDINGNSVGMAKVTR